ncbi:hypothetical protein ACS0TY_015121 [Phlomoides rotata]
MKSKKKKSRAGRHGKALENEQKALKELLEAFSSVSLEEAASAYREAGKDPNRAADILCKRAVMEDQSAASSTSGGNYEVGSCSGSSTNASEVFGVARNFLEVEFKEKSKPKKMKKVIASAGTVSTMLGKDYVRSIPKKKSSKFHEQNWSKEEAEQFLCSMLGDDCELNLAVVSDVLCQCGYNLDKALDVLLDLSASSVEQHSDYYESTSREDSQYLLDPNSCVGDRTSDSTSNSSDVELQDNVWLAGNPFRIDFKASESSGSHHSTETGNLESELLKSLFNMPTPKAAEKEPNTMNWRNIVKKMTSLGQRFENSDSEQGKLIHDKGNEYQVLRGAAHQHWDSMKSYYQNAVTAFSNGEKEYASYLSGQGRLQNKMAREADEKASRDIFTARNKSIENVITIDLHGQHIKQAMKLLKLHLLFGAYVRSVKSFRVITGCGSHGVGKSKLKNSVVNLLQHEGISWSEENRGTLLVRLDGQTDFSFLDSGSESD